MNIKKQARVLSIQSHVVSGYVGNKSAAFPLQVLGIEVDLINTVQLSNHTGYQVFYGQILNEDDLNKLIDGLITNNLHEYTHLLTGYIGSPSFLKTIIEVVRKLKEKNPNLIYVCDPVMGDNGKMYTPEVFKEIYANEIVPVADVITPNQYELELLTKKSMRTVEDIKLGMKEIRKMGPKIVAVSSANVDGKLVAFVDSAIDNKVLSVEIPVLPLLYTGSGDLFAALFLAYMHLESDIKMVLEKTINTVHNVLSRTLDYYKALPQSDDQDSKKRELRLIQSKDLIENPNIYIHAKLM